jgi:uncharacterized protein YndB with AHSA1/START domain
VNETQPVTKSVLLACDPARAFELFTKHAGAWWPEDRRHTDDAASTIRIESSGRFFERATDGTEVELGVVRRFEAAQRLILDWYPGTGPDDPTHVEIRFESVDGGTRVSITHGPGAASDATFRRTASAYERSWDAVLAAFSNTARS